MPPKAAPASGFNVFKGIFGQPSGSANASAATVAAAKAAATAAAAAKPAAAAAAKPAAPAQPALPPQLVELNAALDAVRKAQNCAALAPAVARLNAAFGAYKLPPNLLALQAASLDPNGHQQHKPKGEAEQRLQAAVKQQTARWDEVKEVLRECHWRAITEAAPDMAAILDGVKP